TCRPSSWSSSSSTRCSTNSSPARPAPPAASTTRAASATARRRTRSTRPPSAGSGRTSAPCCAGEALRARRAAPALEEVDQRLELRREVSATWVIEEQARKRRAPRVEDADQAPLLEVLARAALDDVGQAHSLECRDEHHLAVVDQ